MLRRLMAVLMIMAVEVTMAVAIIRTDVLVASRVDMRRFVNTIRRLSVD